MIKVIMVLLFFAVFGMLRAYAEGGFEKDVIKTSAGGLEIIFFGHASLMMKYSAKVIHVDPYGEEADYSILPKADLILLTHEHGDHMDAVAIKNIRTDSTDIVLTRKCAEKVSGGIVMNNGDTKTVMNIKIEAVPAYNIVNKRGDGRSFHPKGDGNGYILTFGEKRVYIAGDTENTPEMKALKNIDVAFLPMNLPYTMTPEMVADAAKAFKPKIIYPYHFGETDTSKLISLLKDSGMEIRIRKMK
ncbi:MAG: MBL fold metallo-hydrolase [Spirochaetes bacterium]|nr:MBL fold metallo-hydrolase [Spirochaetota bacterium]